MPVLIYQLWINAAIQILRSNQRNVWTKMPGVTVSFVYLYVVYYKCLRVMLLSWYKAALTQFICILKSVIQIIVTWRYHKMQYIYMYAFSRRFYPKRLTVIQVIHLYIYFFVSMCVPWELNPRPFALLTQCSNHWATGTQKPQNHGRDIWGIKKKHTYIYIYIRGGHRLIFLI